MLRFPGKYKDSWRYFRHGYVYYKEKPRAQHPQVIYYRCERRNDAQAAGTNCPGVITENVMTGALDLKTNHINHVVHPETYPITENFKVALEHEVRTTLEKFEIIFDRVQLGNIIFIQVWIISQKSL